MWPVFAQSKTQKWMQVVRERLAVDTSNLEAAYNAGDHLLAAQHILFSLPQDQQATGSDSVMPLPPAESSTCSTPSGATTSRTLRRPASILATNL